jgi:HEPN domain-containing protein
MLKEVDPEGVVKAISMMASEAKRLMIAHEEAIRAGAPGLMWEKHAASFCLTVSETIAGSAEALNMIGVRKATARLQGWLGDAIRHQGPLTVSDIKIIADGLSAVIVGYGDELDGRKIFVMTPQYAKYYSQTAPLFGDDVADAFPDAADDINEAGKCLALGVPTACAFHIMRAAESAAATVLNRLGGDPADEHGEIKPFGALAHAIEVEIDKMPRGPKKDAWMKLKSFMAAINRGSRTKIAHPGSVYSEGKAESLMELSKGFLTEAEELLRP